MKKIVVPEGMLKAAWDASLPPRRFAEFDQRSQWLSENPILPEHGVYDELRDECSERDGMELTLDIMKLWQERMFFAPEPEVYEEIEDLLFNIENIGPSEITIRIMKSFDRGRVRPK